MGHSSSKQFNETNVKESNENVGRNSNTGRSEEKSEEHRNQTAIFDGFCPIYAEL